MHRSGTSAITRVLSLLGAALPKHPMLSKTEQDHWEPVRLVHLHDAMLEEAGSRWDDWRGFDPNGLGDRLDHYRGVIRTLLAEEYGDAKLIVIKDPRMCRFAALYAESLSELGIEPRFLLLQRNPLAVMASLRERNGMTPGFAGLLWLRHVLDAVDATRGHRRCFLSYETFLDDWRSAASRAAAALETDWPQADAQAEIDGYLSRDLQHHSSTLADLDGDPRVNDWLKDAYRALLRLEQGEDAEAIAALHRIKAEFDEQAAIFGDASLPEITAREKDLTQKLDKALEWGSRKGVPPRVWAQIKQVIKEVYKSLPLPPLK
jgi:hypothetical protein